VRPPFPNLLANFDPNHALYQLQTTNYDVQSPYAMQFNLSIQRALPGDWVVSAGYSGSRGLHLFRIGDANLAPFTVVNGIKVYQTQLGRMNPNFASITQRITDAQSYYNALQLTAQKQFSHGLRAQISYTFSSPSTTPAESIPRKLHGRQPVRSGLLRPQGGSRAIAFWAKHVFVCNWSYELPFAKSMTGVGGCS